MNSSVFFTSSVSSRTKLLTSVNDQSCNQSYITVIGHVNIGIIFACIGISKSDWLFDTQPRVLQADWLILENTNIEHAILIQTLDRIIMGKENIQKQSKIPKFDNLLQIYFPQNLGVFLVGHLQLKY